jgi:CBS domain-containing protein
MFQINQYLAFEHKKIFNHEKHLSTLKVEWMLIKDIMTKNVVTIDINNTVLDACNRYREFKVGCLVVTDNNIIVGIITERDIIERTILPNKNPATTKIGEIMSQNIKTVHALSSVEKAAEIMKENNIKKLPVILNNEIVGILTVTDISRAISYFSDTLDNLLQCYQRGKDSMDKMMDEWATLLGSLKNYNDLIKH